MKKILTTIVLLSSLISLQVQARALVVPVLTPKMVCTKYDGYWTNLSTGQTGNYNWTLEDNDDGPNQVAMYGRYAEGLTFGPPFQDISFEQTRIFFPHGLTISDWKYFGDLISPVVGVNKTIVSQADYPNGIKIATGFGSGVILNYVDEGQLPNQNTKYKLQAEYQGPLLTAPGGTWRFKQIANSPLLSGSLLIERNKAVGGQVRRYSLRLFCKARY